MGDCLEHEAKTADLVPLPSALRVRYKLPTQLVTATAAFDATAFDGAADDLPIRPYFGVRHESFEFSVFKSMAWARSNLQQYHSALISGPGIRDIGATLSHLITA